tara:strand:- start:2896 stop:3339 length:444 start_codon:yes stop_codon:yes gene_type:complete
MQISEEGKQLIKKFEGCRLEAYKCSAGVWTIGYGRTTNVKEGDTCTQEEAEKWLNEELVVYGAYVNDAVLITLEQNEFDALVAWTYNLGSTNLNNSTMLRVLNENQKEDVPHQMRRWNKANGKVLEGLVRRREAEALLFEGKEWHEV